MRLASRSGQTEDGRSTSSSQAILSCPRVRQRFRLLWLDSQPETCGVSCHRFRFPEAIADIHGANRHRLRPSSWTVDYLHLAHEDGQSQHVSQTDVYLDMSSSLPLAIGFNTHPDKNALINIPVEVDFSNYEKVNGVQLPFQIQKLVNGVVQYDITVQSANVNSGLAPANFSAD